GLELPHPSIFDKPDVYGRVVDVSEREELQLVVEMLAPPDRLLGTEANVAVLIIGELRERLGQLDLRLGERPPGQLDGKALDDLARKRRLLPLAVLFLPCPCPICMRREGEDSARQRPGSRMPENGATVHTNRVHTTFGPSSFSIIEACAHTVPRPRPSQAEPTRAIAACCAAGSVQLLELTPIPLPHMGALLPNQCGGFAAVPAAAIGADMPPGHVRD